MLGRSIPTRLRYEILKRDHFTCQYCGRSAPDVELHVDHLYPHALGGDNDPFNLIASCVQCNLGKSSYPLSEKALKEKQDGIAHRMIDYHRKFGYPLSTAPNAVEKETPDYLYRYPNRILRAFKHGIHAFPRNYSYMPDKKYYVEFMLDEEHTLTVKYIKEYTHRTKAKTLFQDHYPFSFYYTQDEYEKLFAYHPLQVIDEITSADIKLSLLKDDRGFVVLTLLDMYKNTVIPYVFFVPFKHMHFLLTFSLLDD